jgi:hypothetical protein
VSNAALRSSSTNIELVFVSKARGYHLQKSVTSVSVEWKFLNPDWEGLKRLFYVR